MEKDYNSINGDSSPTFRKESSRQRLIKRQTKHVIFRVTEEEFDKMNDLIEQVKDKETGKILKTFKFDKSKFYRLFFFEGMDAVERKLSNPTLCSKCGKPLAISVPRHLRDRMDVCECDKNG